MKDSLTPKSQLTLTDWPISCCYRQFVHSAIAHADYMEFYALCTGSCHNLRLSIAAPS